MVEFQSGKTQSLDLSEFNNSTAIVRERQAKEKVAFDLGNWGEDPWKYSQEGHEKRKWAEDEKWAGDDSGEKAFDNALKDDVEAFETDNRVGVFGWGAEKRRDVLEADAGWDDWKSAGGPMKLEENQDGKDRGSLKRVQAAAVYRIEEDHNYREGRAARKDIYKEKENPTVAVEESWGSAGLKERTGDYHDERRNDSQRVANGGGEKSMQDPWNMQQPGAMPPQDPWATQHAGQVPQYDAGWQGQQGNPWAQQQGDPWTQQQGDPWTQQQGDPWTQQQQSEPWAQQQGAPWGQQQPVDPRAQSVGNQANPWGQGNQEAAAESWSMANEYDDPDDSSVIPGPTRATLVIYSNQQPSATFEVKNKVVNIGRSTDNHVIINDPYASRKQLKLLYVDGHFEMVSLKTDGSVTANRFPFTRIMLKNRDSIEFGKTRIVFMLGSVALHQAVNEGIVNGEPGYLEPPPVTAMHRTSNARNFFLLIGGITSAVILLLIVILLVMLDNGDSESAHPNVKMQAAAEKAEEVPDIEDSKVVESQENVAPVPSVTLTDDEKALADLAFAAIANSVGEKTMKQYQPYGEMINVSVSSSKVNYTIINNDGTVRGTTPYRYTDVKCDREEEWILKDNATGKNATVNVSFANDIDLTYGTIVKTVEVPSEDDPPPSSKATKPSSNKGKKSGGVKLPSKSKNSGSGKNKGGNKGGRRQLF